MPGLLIMVYTCWLVILKPFQMVFDWCRSGMWFDGIFSFVSWLLFLLVTGSSIISPICTHIFRVSLISDCRSVSLRIPLLLLHEKNLKQLSLRWYPTPYFWFQQSFKRSKGLKRYLCPLVTTATLLFCLLRHPYAIRLILFLPMGEVETIQYAAVSNLEAFQIK